MIAAPDSMPPPPPPTAPPPPPALVGRTSGLQRLAFWVGPGVALAILLFANLEPGKPLVTRTAAVAVWMAIWWVTAPVPLAVTALLPLALFPALGVLSARDVSPEYFNYLIVLFLGGFMVALAMERWHLHRRIGLAILMPFGPRPRLLLLGFMVATAVLSMWISNTATALMMLPIAMAVLTQIGEGDTDDGGRSRGFAAALLLGVAYASSIGGVATIVGTPPNVAFVRIFEEQFPAAPPISFAAWMAFATPLAALLLGIAWLVLVWLFVPAERLDPEVARERRDLLRATYRRLGPMSREEWLVLADFAILAVLWITRADIEVGDARVWAGWENLFPAPSMLADSTPAMAMALLLFLIPARRRPPGEVAFDGDADAPTRLLDASMLPRLPWGIVLLFGGGFALSKAFSASGLSAWLGDHLEILGTLPPWLLVLLITLFISFLTELTSNTATAQILLPVLASLALAIDIDPLLLMVPGALACSFAFMLPVATPPNAIIFGTGRLRPGDMARAGFVLNLLGVALVTLFVFVLGPATMGISPGAKPAWVEVAAPLPAAATVKP